jgi:hypothetical protein
LRREKDGGMEDILLAMATGYDYRKYQNQNRPGDFTSAVVRLNCDVLTGSFQLAYFHARVAPDDSISDG